MTLQTTFLALAATLAVAAFAMGWRLYRADVASQLDVADLVLLREVRKGEAKGRVGPLARLANRLAPAIERMLGPRLIGLLQRQIEYAGRPAGLTVPSLIQRVAMWLVITVPAMLLFLAQGQLPGVLLLLVIAIFIPVSRVFSAARARQESIDLDLPDFLDILSVTVTAGIAFRAALRRVSGHFEGPLAEEIQLTLDQLDHGASLRQAFEQLRARCGSAAMDSFVRAFLQSEELGAPLAETLGQISLDLRRERAQRLRRKAAQVVPRITLVSSLVLVPGTLLLVIGGTIFGSGIDLTEMFSQFGG